MMGAFEELKKRWMRASRAKNDPRMEPMRADDSPEVAVHGIARRGETTTLFVEDEARVDPVHAMAQGMLESVEVEVREALHEDPKSPDGWGVENAYEGRLVGGKSFGRGYDEETSSGGTLSFVGKDAQGGPVLVGNHHCFTPPQGTKHPDREFEMWETAEGAQVFGDVTGWMPFTREHDQWPNLIDAAVGRPSPQADMELETAQVAELGPIEGTATVDYGDELIKNGATTGITEGEVTITDYTTEITYDGWPGEPTIVLDDCFQVTRMSPGVMSDEGDSGSPVLKEINGAYHLVGVLFGGHPDHGAVVCRIENVLDAFGISVGA